MDGLRTPRFGPLVQACALLAVAATTLPAQEPAPPGPGPDHEILLSLLGDWSVSIDGTSVGAARGSSVLDDRFVALEITADRGPIRHAIYTFGFDRRHETYTVIAMDDSGTYWVTASGDRTGQRIAMYGTDEDPVMRSMGLDKELGSC
jgi:hypothetical protein